MKRANLSIAALLSLPLSLPLWAQTSDNSSAAQDTGQGDSQLEEIFVTAQRREESLQSVPIAITTISGNAIQSFGFTDTTSLPQISATATQVRSQNGIFTVLRGIGTYNVNIGDDSANAFYVDGVYIAALGGGALFSFNNLDRIEVLNGPQGTLYGRNALGGVVNYITKTPQSTPSADVSAGYGNYGTTTSNFYGTTAVPGVANLDADVAISYSGQKDGWGRDLFTGGDIFKDEDDFGARTKWRWHPTDATSVTLTFDYFSSLSSQGYLQVVPGAVPGARLYGTYGFVGWYNNQALPALEPGRNTQYGEAVTIHHEMSWANFVSISAWRDFRSTSFSDVAIVPLYAPGISTSMGRAETQTGTQEFQLLSPSGSAISWVTGLFFLHDLSGDDPVFLRTNPNYTNVKLLSTQETISYAAYGQATVTVLPETHLTGGLRYTDDERKMHGDEYFLNAAGVPIAVAASTTYRQSNANYGDLTYTLDLDHNFTKDVLVYATKSLGFKSGTFNTSALTAPPVPPETNNAYEIGLKSQWFDQRLRLNPSAFYYDLSHVQLQQLGTNGLTLLTSAGAAEIKGADMDIAAVPLRRLTLDGGIAYLNTRITNYPGAPVVYPTGSAECPAAPSQLPYCSSFANLAGFQLSRAPRWKGNLGAQYELPTSAEYGTWDLAANYSLSSHYYATPQNFIPTPGYAVVNSSLKWIATDGRWWLRLWSDNLFNKRYFSVAQETAFGNLGVPEPPRTYGLTVGAHLF
jgi:iron complex outermembrane receptor protein